MTIHSTSTDNTDIPIPIPIPIPTSSSTSTSNNGNGNNNKQLQNKKSNKAETLWLYDSKTQALLKQAHEQAVQKQQQEDASANRLYPVVRTYDEDYDQLSLPSEDEDENENEEGDHSSSSSNQSSSSEEEEKEETQDKESTATKGKQTKPQKLPKATKKKEMTPKQTIRLQQEIRQHYSNLIKTAVPIAIQQDDNAAESSPPLANNTDSPSNAFTHNLQLSSALLTKSEQQYGTPVSKAKAFCDLSTQLSSNSDTGYVVVLLLQSGKFAGGVFLNGRCIEHKTMQKYTVRKGQGKAQSAQDGKRKPKSMGSQLRRQGELQLKEDIQTLLWKDWKTFLQKASLLLISCPKTMVSTLLDTPTGPQWSSLHNHKQQPILSRKDGRIRKIPINVGRPTYETVYMVHQVLLQVSLEPITIMDGGGDNGRETAAVVETDTTTADHQKNKDDSSKEPKPNEEEIDETIPLLHLHHLCKAGNHGELADWLQTTNGNDDDSRAARKSINQQAGVDFMTPLHYAAASCVPPPSASPSEKNNDSVDTPSSPEQAALCVYDLLVQGKAVPTILDTRLRPAYFLAGHDKVREAFRKARAALGEDYCDWKAAQVGPPLSEEVVEQKKAKEAEKRRRKKAKAKEKKAMERQAQEEAAKEKAKQEEEERVTGDASGGRACDCCRKAIRGRKNVFKRLEYEYCSTKCVNDHKRELMASAALARFGG
ncbi:unnamed protein product [Cylindrotheca closterium]|uniref:VLRF1 domain-containing protein n=1 Tax=Cylindrotheca closterium TaxID=2856 RepID=A0AAD2CIL4_9STRA|nr:unnamed protein product [Cylindrotheca closterium]